MQISPSLASYMFLAHSPSLYDPSKMTDTMAMDLENQFNSLKKSYSIEQLYHKIALK